METNKRLIGLMFMLVGLLSACSAMADESGRTISAVKSEEAVKVDGKLDDAVWQKAQHAIFDIDINGKQSPAATEAAVAYDKDNIYFAFICRYPAGTEIKAPERARDGSVWEDEGVELFLDPGLTRERASHFIVNASGSIYDGFVDQGGKRDDGNWDFNVTTAVGKEGDKWILEMAIPFRALNVPSSDKSEWGINFCRTYSPKNGDNVLFNWAGYAGAFAQPAKFGILSGLDLKGRLGAAIDFPEQAIEFGEGKLPVRVGGLKGAVTAQVVIAVMDTGGKEVGKYQEGFEAPAEGKAAAVAYRTDLAGGQLVISAMVKDPASGQVLAEVLRKMKFSGLFEMYFKSSICFLNEKPLLAVGIKCREETLKRFMIDCELKNKEGVKRALPPLGIERQKTVIPLAIGDLGEGEYELTCRLRDGEKVLKEISSSLIVIKGPFDNEKGGKETGGN